MYRDLRARLLALSTLCLLIVAACSSTESPDTGSTTVPEEAILVVGDFANPPFSSWDDDGNPVGLEVDILADVGRELGRPVVWRELPFVELLPSVASGEALIAASTIGITPERAERVGFSRPYFETEISIVTRGGPDVPDDSDGFRGLRVGAGRATTSEAAVRRELPDARLVVDRDGERTFAEMLLAGELDALVMDRTAADRLIAEHGEKLRILDGDLGKERYGFAVCNCEEELIETIDAAIERRIGAD